MIKLAELLDNLCLKNWAHVTETETKVLVSAVNFSNSIEVLEECRRLGWEAEIYDEEGTKWGCEEIFKEAEPFRISFEKPISPKGGVRILTNTGFDRWLRDGSENAVWLLATIKFPIKTYGRLICPWDYSLDFIPKEKTKNPRRLVRENTEIRGVPDDINVWLIDDFNNLDYENSAFRLWAKNAIAKMLLSLPNEVNFETQALKFNGPPKLVLNSICDLDCPLSALGVKGFLSLHEAVCWVYENERESEVKHALLANEISRTGREVDEALTYINMHIFDALCGAKVAYQMSISEVGKETLKALADLRKSVTDETSKVAESTRQIITAIATSLAVGIGLIAARLLSSNLPDFVIPAIMVVVVIHVAAVIISGLNYINIQRTLRGDWQSRLYRFIPTGEYNKMVEEPISRAASSFYIVSWLGSAAVIILALIVFFGGQKSASNVSYDFIKNVGAGGVVRYMPRGAGEEVPPAKNIGRMQ